MLALAAAALAQALLYVVMTEAGFSGNPGYVLPALAVACLLAGIGGGYVAGRPRGVALAAVFAVALLERCQWTPRSRASGTRPARWDCA